MSERDVNVKAAVREHYASVVRESGAGCGCGPAAISCCGPTSAPVKQSKELGYTEQDLAAVPDGSNLGLGPAVLVLADQLHAVEARHHDVGEDEVERRALDGHDLTAGEGLWIAARESPATGPRVLPADPVVSGPRVGVGYAGEPWASLPLRFGIADHRALSRPFSPPAPGGGGA